MDQEKERWYRGAREAVIVAFLVGSGGGLLVGATLVSSGVSQWFVAVLGWAVLGASSGYAFVRANRAKRLSEVSGGDESGP